MELLENSKELFEHCDTYQNMYQIYSIALLYTLGDYPHVPLGFHSPNDHRGERCRCSDIPRRHHCWQGLVLLLAASFVGQMQLVVGLSHKLVYAGLVLYLETGFRCMVYGLLELPQQRKEKAKK